MQTLLHFWEKLKNVNELSFQSTTYSNQKTGWKGEGKGIVTIYKQDPHILIFNEKGSWCNELGLEMNFSNIFRWSLDLTAGVISLEHLRQGPEHPVFLFHLAPTGSYSLASIDSHLCEGDVYFGQIQFDGHNLRFNWRVIGPKKNEEINYYYA